MLLRKRPIMLTTMVPFLSCAVLLFYNDVYKKQILVIYFKYMVIHLFDTFGGIFFLF